MTSSTLWYLLFVCLILMYLFTYMNGYNHNDTNNNSLQYNVVFAMNNNFTWWRYAAIYMENQLALFLLLINKCYALILHGKSLIKEDLMRSWGLEFDIAFISNCISSGNSQVHLVHRSYIRLSEPMCVHLYYKYVNIHKYFFHLVNVFLSYNPCTIRHLLALSDICLHYQTSAYTIIHLLTLSDICLHYQTSACTTRHLHVL